MSRIILCLLAACFLYSYGADVQSYESRKQNLIESNFKFEGTRSLVYEDSIKLDLEIYCGGWFVRGEGERLDSIKKCFLISKGSISRVDSFVRNDNHYEVFEDIYDVNQELVFSGLRTENIYSEYRYDSGKLLTHDELCDTIHEAEKSLCFGLLSNDFTNLEQDRFGKFVMTRERFVWDEKGRLKQRIVSGPLNSKINGTYDFFYKTPCDSVRVEPVDYVVDWDALSEKGKYDGSFGKMPEKDDPEYAEFAKNPYEFEATPELLERQKKRCEDYKKSLKKGNGNHR
ncbi:MAG: hypothetical protein MJZ25_14675 [Fibrobacter sp.]|nr:hypothetical protein [Fibrobacter sp.]